MSEGVPLKILIVEDEFATRELTKSTLERVFPGSKILTAENGADAVQIVQQEQPTLIIQDIGILTSKCNMSGFDCIREYRKFNGTVKIIVVSGNPPDESELEGYGVSYILAKPYGAASIENAIKKVLGLEYSAELARKKNNDYSSEILHPDKLIHKINSGLYRLRFSLDNYKFKFNIDDMLSEGSSEYKCHKLKEALQKMLDMTEVNIKEIDDIFKDVEKIKSLKVTPATIIETEPTQYIENSDKLKLLIVEDVDEILNVSVRYFRNTGFNVVGATNGCEALSLIDKEIPDLILLDIQMPQMDGFTFMRELRARNLSIKIIIVSAYHSDEMVKEASVLGAVDYLFKPLSLAEIKEGVLKQLGERINLRN